MTEEYEWQFVSEIEQEDLQVDESFWDNVWTSEYEEV